MEDHQIIDLYWARNERAITETDAVYGSKLHALADRIVRSHEDAEENVSDTYMKTWNTLPPQRPVYFFAYLAKICRNLALGMLEHRNALKRNADVISLTAELEQCIPDRRVEDAMDGKEIGNLLDCFLTEISRENRMIFLRRYWYADSVQQIAERYGITQSNVKIRLHRTRGKLRAFLEQEGIAL